MIGLLTALLGILIVIATINVREGVDSTLAPEPSGEAYFNSVPTDYQELMDTYSRVYIFSKKANGTDEALNSVRESIDQYHNSMRKQVIENQAYIQTFLDNYKDVNPELDRLHKKSQLFKDEGPKIADELVASSKEVPVSINYGDLITRTIVLALILGSAFMVNAFSS